MCRLTRSRPTSPWPFRKSGSPDDDVVLETAFTGKADTVVSRDEDLKGDQDLARLLREAGIEMLSVRRFLEVLD
jgi:predicted nucleic acid-binding protein